jgi:Tfp pilus assembly protein PilF
MKEQPNLENLLQLGITAAKDGNKEGARVLLKQVLDMNKKNDRAWVWLASVAESNQQRRQYLETALKYNPQNEQAQKALQKISAKRSNKEQRTLMIGVFVLLLVLVLTAFVCLMALAFS